MELVYYTLKNDDTTYKGQLIYTDAGCILLDYSGMNTIKQSDLASITTTEYSQNPNIRLYP